MECPLLTVLTAVIVYGDNKRKCQLPCPAISAHVVQGGPSDYGGPILAETDGPGGPLVVEDRLFCDRSTHDMFCIK